LRWPASGAFTLLGASADPPAAIRAKGDAYCRAALRAGQEHPLEKVSVACFVYVADGETQARNDLREAVNLELSYQKQRGVLKYILARYTLPKAVDDMTFDDLVDLGMYMIGDPDTVAGKLRRYYDEAGGFGTLLVIAGKGWADRDKRLRSIRRFAAEVAPRLAHLVADRGLEPIADWGW
jgi:alkanesulfonate monooxygenase SsuD/methylene tetrahydromethanopterin reductase-like flavin-dependent oxidoreductase (luciferase family)